MTRLMLVLGVVGCVQSNTITCPDGSTCPQDATCVIAAGSTWCATDDQLASCSEMADGTACSFSGAAGTCFGGVCLPAECGNLRVDVGEQCDDANAETGDGCSPDCRSDETCGNGVVDPTRNEECDDLNHVDHDGCSSTCIRETPVWRTIESAPTPRFGAAMAYDAEYDRVLLFGGSSQSPSAGTDLQDLWAWNGDGWTPVSTPIAPAARTFHAMAYDAAAKQTIMFGGVRLDQATIEGADPDPFGDTWAWDGGSWSFVDTAQSPVARSLHAMAYDAARKRVVLYGGSLPWDLSSQPPALDDTWEWTGTTWTQLCTACGPGPREAHAMAYDPIRGVIVLFGGRESKAGKLVDTTWELRNGGWSEVITTAQPPARTGARLAFDPIANVMVLSSGIGKSGPLADTWQWDGVTWVEVTTAPPSSATYDAATATDPRRREVITFGGHVVNSPPIGETDRWMQTEWKGFTPSEPAATYDHAAAFDAARGQAVMWGGWTMDTVTWQHDGEHWIPSDVAPMPSRQGHKMAYDPLRREVVLAGGMDTGFATATWVRRDGVWIDAQAPAPARLGHGLAFDGTRVILFGGEYQGFFADTWAWTGSAWTQLSPATHPSERIRFAMAYDPSHARVVVFGGYFGGGFLNDTWAWDGSTWTQLVTPTKPQARDRASLVWDPWRGRLVLFGGSSSTSLLLDDAWELDGSTWTQLVLPVRPAARLGHVMFATPHGVVLHGNTGNDATAWRLRWESYEREESCTGGDDHDGDGLAGCSDPDCWTRCSPLCPPGTSCPAGAPFCGDGTCGTVEDCGVCPDDCGACNVCGDATCDASETMTACPGDCTP